MMHRGGGDNETRQDLNQRDFMKRLQQMTAFLLGDGYQILELNSATKMKTMNFAEIMMIFAESAVIIALHGAEENMIACQPNTILIEFLVYDQGNFCYRNMAARLGIGKHHVLLWIY